MTVTFPELFDQAGSKVLAAYISHVITSERYPLASITVQNTGSTATTMEVSIDLPSYGSRSTQTVSLEAGQIQNLTLSPIIDYARLFANTAALPAALNVSVTAGATSLFQQSYPIEISGRDTVFWSNDGNPTAGLVATMVTPNDKAGEIGALLRKAAPHFPGNALVGYQTGASWPAQSSGAMAPGAYVEEAFLVLDEEQIAVSLDSVVNGAGAPDTASVFILDDSNYQGWRAGAAATACAADDRAGAGSLVTCARPSADTRYHVVYQNPTMDAASRTIVRRRPMTKWETTYHQTRAIFEQLRSQGMLYVNLPGTGFFSESQNVLYPSESLALAGANCIEGALVFASAWERMAMDPILAIVPAHGHAFAAVRCWPGSDCVIPVETTMVGSGATFADAVDVATSNWNAWASDGSLSPIDIADARAVGLTPAPM